MLLRGWTERLCFFVGGRNDFEFSEFCEPGPWLRGFDVYREDARAERRRQLEANARERVQVTMPPRESDDEAEEVNPTLPPVTSDQRHMLPTPAETSLTTDGYDKTDGFVVDDDDEDVPSDEDVDGPSEWQHALNGTWEWCDRLPPRTSYPLPHRKHSVSSPASR